MRSHTRNIILLVVALLSVVSLSAMAAPEHARLFSQRPKYDHNRLVRVKAMDDRTLHNLLDIIGKEPDGTKYIYIGIIYKIIFLYVHTI